MQQFPTTTTRGFKASSLPDGELFERQHFTFMAPHGCTIPIHATLTRGLSDYYNKKNICWSFPDCCTSFSLSSILVSFCGFLTCVSCQHTQATSQWSPVLLRSIPMLAERLPVYTSQRYNRLISKYHLSCQTVACFNC